MDSNAVWSIQVWEADEYWHWDVRSPGLRCTGERGTWREAYDMAGAELAEMRSSLEGGGVDVSLQP